MNILQTHLSLCHKRSSVALAQRSSLRMWGWSCQRASLFSRSCLQESSTCFRSADCIPLTGGLIIISRMLDHKNMGLKLINAKKWWLIMLIISSGMILTITNQHSVECHNPSTGVALVNQPLREDIGFNERCPSEDLHKDRPLVKALESMELSPRTDPYVFMVDAATKLGCFCWWSMANHDHGMRILW